MELAGDVPPRIIVLIEHRDAVLTPAAREFKRVAVPVARRILAGDAPTETRARAS